MDCIADLVPKCSYFVCEACIGKGGEILDSNQSMAGSVMQSYKDAV